MDSLLLPFLFVWLTGIPLLVVDELLERSEKKKQSVKK